MTWSRGTAPEWPGRAGRRPGRPIRRRRGGRSFASPCGPIERFFNRLKQYRWVATRYEKLGQNYLSVVFLASTLISLL